MANLKSIAELAWRQIHPNPGDRVKVAVEQLIADAKTEFGYQIWVKGKAEKREEGYFEVPSYLLSEVNLEVIDGVMDLSGLRIMRSLDRETWIQNVGGVGSKCVYVKSTINMMQLLNDDDSLGADARRYYMVGDLVKFPDGVHQSPLPVTYANRGEKINDKIEVDDTIGSIIRKTLLEMYLGKEGREDKTNNNASDT